MYYSKKTLSLITLLTAFSLCSCSYIHGDKSVLQNRDTDYLKAKSIQPLKIPPGTSSDTIETQYPVPERSYPDNAKNPNLTPPGL